MKHKYIEELAHKYIIEKAYRSANPRAQQILYRILSDLFKTIEDLDITDDEVWTALDLLTEAGKNDEIKLLSAGLGIDRFLDIRQEEAEARYSIAGATPRSIEGPLYVHGAPVERHFARLDDGTEDNEAEILFMRGQVTDVNGQPLPAAIVEVWHANSRGNYSFFDENQSEYNLRRTIITDENGRYEFRSILPAGYGVPPDGTTQKILDALGRHGQRPPHLHFFIQADGHRRLTTQINLPGSPFTEDDYAFADLTSLVPQMERVTDQEQISAKGVSRPFYSISYNFRLHPNVPGAPPPEVERSRAKDYKDHKKGSQDAASYYALMAAKKDAVK